MKTVAADIRNLRHAVNKEVVKKDVYDAKIKGIEDKILNITKLANIAALNARMKDVKTKYLVLQVNYNCCSYHCWE